MPLCTASVWISSHTREMKNLLRFGLMSTLLLATFGCAAESSEKAAADARVQAADARVDAADANARVKAADAHVRAADARVKAADAGVEAAEADARVNSTQLRQRGRPCVESETGHSIRNTIESLSDRCTQHRRQFVQGTTSWRAWQNPSWSMEPRFFRKGRRSGAVLSAVESSGRVKGLASIRLALTDIMQGDRVVAITTTYVLRNSRVLEDA